MPDARSNPEIHMKPKDMEDLEPYVDLFSIMTYDFKGGRDGVPMAPILYVL